MIVLSAFLQLCFFLWGIEGKVISDARSLLIRSCASPPSTGPCYLNPPLPSRPASLAARGPWRPPCASPRLARLRPQRIVLLFFPGSSLVYPPLFPVSGGVRWNLCFAACCWTHSLPLVQIHLMASLKWQCLNKKRGKCYFGSLEDISVKIIKKDIFEDFIGVAIFTSRFGVSRGIFSSRKLQVNITVEVRHLNQLPKIKGKLKKYMNKLAGRRPQRKLE